jgi:hypothetical protein
MSAALLSRFDDTQNGDFRKKVAVAMVEAAINNVGEAIATGVDADKRTAFAKAVIDNPLAHLEHVLLAVVADGTDNASTDAAIRTRVGNLWNAFAGVRTGE